MKAENVTRMLVRVNTLAFLALAVYFVKSKSQGSKRRVLVAIAASVALQYMLPLLMDLAMLGSVRVDASSNKLVTESDVDRRSGGMIFRAKYNDPESFQDYVFAYDPAKVYFDRYSVNYTRRSRKFNSGPRSDKGEAFPGEKDWRMISLPAAAGVGRTYRQPSGSKDPNFVSSVIVQFFYEKGNKTEAEHEEKLAKFKNIEGSGRFMIKQGGKFETVQRA